jgi:hypothetical protein
MAASLPAAWLGAGFNAYLIRNTWAPRSTPPAPSSKIDGKWGIAITKSHYQDHRGKRFGGRARQQLARSR